MSDWTPSPEPDGPQAAEQPAPIEVRAGERAVPAPGPEAAAAARPGTEVHYVFPIHVILAGDATQEDTGRDGGDDIAAAIWDALYQALS
ncbi:hypothetical protein AB0442_35875 [Kitasatospora sp. NPDC085895]|uniref:hypothetical protein n=1 Tax=Kitasatospora sp. NPDC085895 TaxID=3155057 RepID=UPI00344E66D6